MAASLQTHDVRRSLRTRVSLCVLGLSLLCGCSSFSPEYIERHEVENLTVVFLDEKRLHEQWKRVTGQRPVRFVPKVTGGGFGTIKTVRGFYDFRTNTIYCPKWDFEVCGHELHHATVGHFHPPIQ